MNPSAYAVTATLRDGRRIELRAIRPDDRAAMLEAFDRMSLAARQLRFFTPKRNVSEAEVRYYLDVDFVQHVALVAVVDDDGGRRIAGAGRYIVTSPGRAEVAFGVADAWQGQGIGGMLMSHLASIARDAGLAELHAEVLRENGAMLKVFERSGLPMRTRYEEGVVHVVLTLSPAAPGQDQTKVGIAGPGAKA